MAKKKDVIKEDIVEETTDIVNKVVEEATNNTKDETKVEKIDKEKGFPFGAIIIALVFIITVFTVYFVFMRDTDDKKSKESNKNNNSSNKEDINKLPKTDKAYNDILDYTVISSKVKNAKKNVLIKCDCSKVKDEGSADKAVCSKYTVSNDLFLSIIDKLKQTKDAQVLPTGSVCSVYSFESDDENGKRIIFGFTGDNLKNILVSYDGEGYAFDYDKDLTSFFESIISFSTKESKDDKQETDNSKKELNNEEISIMKKVDKYSLMELIYSSNSISFSKDKLLDVQLNMLETFIINKYYDSWKDRYDDDSEISFSKSDADNYFQDLYGFKPDNYRDINCSIDDEALFYYKNGKFIWNKDHPGHGEVTTEYIDYDVVDFDVKDNLYTITLSFVYGHEEMGFYINGESLGDLVEYDYDPETESYDKVLNSYKAYFQKHKDEYKKNAYKFTFEKKNNNYYLKSFSKQN
ncbi:MAG: hypothetical protein IKX00_04305 [Bacilli bacterium]|nr:hypothetical protein [Bacilli bacterium]